MTWLIKSIERIEGYCGNHDAAEGCRLILHECRALRAHIELTDCERSELDALRHASEQITASVERSRQFLIDAGICTPDGELAEPYRDVDE